MHGVRKLSYSQTCFLFASLERLNRQVSTSFSSRYLDVYLTNTNRKCRNNFSNVCTPIIEPLKNEETKKKLRIRHLKLTLFFDEKIYF